MVKVQYKMNDQQKMNIIHKIEKYLCFHEEEFMVNL